MMEVLKT